MKRIPRFCWMYLGVVVTLAVCAPGFAQTEVDTPVLVPVPPAIWVGPPVGAPNAIQADADTLARELVARRWVNPDVIPQSWLVDPMDPDFSDAVVQKLTLAEQRYFEMEPQQASTLYSEALGMIRRDPRCLEPAGGKAKIDPSRVIDHAALAYRIFVELGSPHSAQALLDWICVTLPETRLSPERHPPAVVQQFTECLSFRQVTGKLTWSTDVSAGSCQLWLNGYPRSLTSPVTLPVGEYLASIRCDDKVSWYRPVRIREDQETTLMAAPHLESLVRRGPYGLRFMAGVESHLTTLKLSQWEVLSRLAKTVGVTVVGFDDTPHEDGNQSHAVWIRLNGDPCVFAAISEGGGDGPENEIVFPKHCQSVVMTTPQDEKPSMSGVALAGWSLLGVGLAGLAGGGVVNILHSSHVSDGDPPTSDDDVRQEEQLQNLAVGLYIGGAVTLATGITMLVIDACCINNDSVEEAPLPPVGISPDQKIWFRFQF